MRSSINGAVPKIQPTLHEWVLLQKRQLLGYTHPEPAFSNMVVGGWVENTNILLLGKYFSNLQRQYGSASLAATVQIGVSILLSSRREGGRESWLKSQTLEVLSEFQQTFKKYFFIYYMLLGPFTETLNGWFFKNNFLHFLQGAIPWNPLCYLCQKQIFLVSF